MSRRTASPQEEAKLIALVNHFLPPIIRIITHIATALKSESEEDRETHIRKAGVETVELIKDVYESGHFD